MQSSSKHSRLAQALAEIKGKPGVVWGNVIVPDGGRSKITIKIVNDLLQTNVDLAYGLEKKEIVTPIQDVKAIEIVEGRLWWLLVLGVITLIYFIGIIFIILFFVIKQRWIIIYTSSVSLILFYKTTENVEQFRETVLKIRRQLNTPEIIKPNGTHSPLPVPPPLPNNA
jgi:hypothetical protein